MTCFDMRKWTERKIALWAFWLSIGSLLIGGYFSFSAHRLNEKTFCFNHVNPKIETIKGNIYDLPRLLSGCAIEPKTYCGNARSIVTKTENLVLEVEGSLAEKIESIDNLAGILSRTKHHLADTNNGRRDDLVADADSINAIRRSLGALNTKNIECSSQLF